MKPVMRRSWKLATLAAALMMASGLGASQAMAGVSIGLSVPLAAGPVYSSPPVYYSPPPPTYYNVPPTGYSTTTTDAYGNTVVVSQPTPGIVVTQPTPVVVAPGYYGYGPYPGYGYGYGVNPVYLGGYLVGRRH